MNKLFRIVLIYLILVISTAYNNDVLTKRVQITNDVSVLMPQDFERTDLNNGQVRFQSKIGSTDLIVAVIKDMSMATISIDQLKKGMEINVARFLEPMKGKLLHRKDTIIGNVVKSDFEFEIVNQKLSKHGVGRFIIKGNNFISFLIETLKPDTKENDALRESFFRSIKID